jgi:hypothetical protein
MKLAYLVLGPESSGTRLMTRILMACMYRGDGDHVQAWDRGLPDLPRIVWRRSAPHGSVWPNVSQLVRELRQRKFDVRAFVMHRDWHACAASQVAAGHVKGRGEAFANIKHALTYIPAELLMLSVPFECVYYDMLGLEEYRTALLKRWDLQVKEALEEIRSAPRKYYVASHQNGS